MNEPVDNRIRAYTQMLQEPNLMPGFSSKVIASAVKSAFEQASERATQAIDRVALCLSVGGSAYRASFMDLHYATERLPEHLQVARLATRLLA